MLGQKLHIERSGNLQLAGDRRGDLPDLADGREVERLWRQHESGVAGMHTRVLDMLADGPEDQLPLVGNRVDLDLARMSLELGNDHRVLGVHSSGPPQDTLELVRFVGNAHRRAAEHVARADQNREAAETGNGFLQCLEVGDVRPLRLLDPHPVQEIAELLAVFGTIDAFCRGAEDSHSGLVEGKREVVGQLSAHTEDDALRLFLFVDVEHRLEADLIEDQSVAHVVVGAHGFGVVVDHDGLIAELGRRLDCIDAAPVELDARADPVGPGAQNHHLLTSGPAHLGGVRLVGRVEIVGLGGELRGGRVDVGQPRLDAVLFPGRPRRAGRLAGEAIDPTVAETQLLRPPQPAGLERRSGLGKLAVHVDHLPKPVQEPGVDVGQPVDLFHRHAVAQSLGNGKDAQRRSVLDLVPYIFELEQVRFETIGADIEHPEGLLDNLGKAPADRHDFADAFHFGADANGGAPELGNIPTRNLAHQIVERRFEESRRAAGDAVRDLRQAVADRDLRRHVCQRIAGGLAGESARSR